MRDKIHDADQNELRILKVGEDDNEQEDQQCGLIFPVHFLPLKRRYWKWLTLEDQYSLMPISRNFWLLIIFY